MAYEPLNFENFKTVLTAEQLNHIQNGIANVLPQNPSAYQYPATDGDGNMVWADRLAYSDEQRVYWNGIDNFQFAGTEPDSSNYELWTTPFDTNASYSVLFDGVLYKDVTLISGEYTADLGSVGFSDYPFVVGYDLEMGRVGYIQTSVDGNHTISIYTASESVKTIDPKFLPEGIGGDKVVFFDEKGPSFAYENGTAISSFDDLHNIFFEMAFGKGKCICQFEMDGGMYAVGIESLFYHVHNRFWRIVFSPIGSNKLSVLVSIPNQTIEIEEEG